MTLKRYFWVVFSLLTLAFPVASVHAGNPGKSAMECIKVLTNAQSMDNLVFENHCNHEVFVVWCGELKYSKKKCGEGSKNSFYTHSVNIEANKQASTTIKSQGSFRYAACIGGIGFGSKGIDHPATAGGHFTCTATGQGKNMVVEQTKNQAQALSLLGSWLVYVGEQKTTLTLSEGGRGSYYSFDNQSSYPARWTHNDGKVNMRVYGTDTHYSNDEPAIILDMTIRGNNISGIQRSAIPGYRDFKVEGRKTVQ
ncbi:hypothetical protein [Motilimonas sp. KMU-193]|uniref:hypothetical protein n=1 Tax=Motilimonas sp. KMU-193 TaxID=3388668 RepID=UPI00396B15C2